MLLHDLLTPEDMVSPHRISLTFALYKFVIEDIRTTISLHRCIFDDPDFQKGHMSTTFLERFLAIWTKRAVLTTTLTPLLSVYIISYIL